MLTWLLQLTGRMRAFFGERNLDRDFDQELQSHLEMLSEEHRRRGLTPEQARRAASLELGDLAQLREAHREVRGMPLLGALLQDLQYAFRTLSKAPGFTMTALAVLALGIGVTTAIFLVINAVLLKPIPFPDPDRLVVLMTSSMPQGLFPGASPAKFQFWKSQSDVLKDVSAMRDGVMNYTADGVAEQVQSEQVSVDFFRCFGARIARGRSFTPTEDLPDGPHVVVISNAFWLREFARDPRIVGQTVALNGDQYKVIGILTDRFRSRESGPAPEVYVPFQLDQNARDQGYYFTVAARLKPGVSLDRAKAWLQRSTVEYSARFHIAPTHEGFTVAPYREAVTGGVRFPLLVLAGAVSLVFLIASVNVANLLLVRAAERRREIGIRMVIGAGRGRIVRQLLTESVLLSLTGGLLGLLLGFVGIRALLAVNTAGLPRVGLDGTSVGIDWRVMLFTIAVSVIDGIVFGLLPALYGSSRADANGVLKYCGGRPGADFRPSKALPLLVVGEASLAVILLVGSALLIRTSFALAAIDPGFDAKNVLTVRTSATGPRFATSANVEQMIREGVERIRALPGVLAVGTACCLPLQGGFSLPFTIVGKSTASGPRSGGAGWTPASPGFFEVFRIPVKRGRAFTDRDDSKSPAVALINEAMVKRYWKASDPLKDRIAIVQGGMKEFNNEPAREIIGVVGDIRSNGLRNPPPPTIYIPQGQLQDAATLLGSQLVPMAWVVRTETEPNSLAAAVEEQLRQASELPVSDVQSMGEVASQSTSPHRFRMLLMTIFGACALLLAAIGVYGLMTYTVERRRKEIGIRNALGARENQVRNAVVLQGMRLVLAGVAIGIMTACGLTRFIAPLLFGVQPRDPMVFIMVPIVLSAVALLGVWFPARRASRIDAMEVLLRYE